MIIMIFYLKVKPNQN